MPTTVDALPVNEEASRRWFFGVLLALLVILGVNLVVAWRMDVFGVMRDARGRSLVTSHHERKAKFLLNQAYVPENFNALIVGNSGSMNWRPWELTGYRFYDESLEGGNATEERTMVEPALRRGHFKVALVGMFPTVTASHSYEDGLDKANRAEALGSIFAFDIEYQTIRTRYLHGAQTFYPDGSHEMPTRIPERPKPGDPAWDLKFDPQSLKDYQVLIHDLEARGTKIIYVVYAPLGPLYDPNETTLTNYIRDIPQMMPQAPIINLNDPQYDWFTNDPGNYIDWIHLSRSGADKITRVINERMHEILKD